MTTTTYKDYTLLNVGLSQYIFRPGKFDRETQHISDLYGKQSDGYAQSLAEAKRWINQDIKKSST